MVQREETGEGKRGCCTRSITTTKGCADDPASNIDMLLHPAFEYPATAGMLYRRRNPSLCHVAVDLDRYGRTGSCLDPPTANKTLGIQCVCIHSPYHTKHIYHENASCPLLTNPPPYAIPFPGTHSIRPPNLSIQVRIQKAIVGIQLAKRMLREQHICRRPLCRAPVGFSQHRHPSTSHEENKLTL